MEYRFLKTEEEYKQVAEIYAAKGIQAPNSTISPTVGAFEGDKLTDFIVLAPIYVAQSSITSGAEVEENLVELINSNLANFPGAQYYTFVPADGPSTAKPREEFGLVKVPVDVYLRSF